MSRKYFVTQGGMYSCMKITFARYTQINDQVRTLHYFDWDIFFARPICNTSPVRLMYSEFIAKFESDKAGNELSQFIKNREHELCERCRVYL